MISTIIDIMCLLILSAITIQDFLERKVFIWLFVGIGLLMPLLYLTKTNTLSYFINIAYNLVILFVIISVLFIYSKLKLKQPLLSGLGLGDILFFFIIAISFPLPSFLVLFSCSLIFSMILFFLLRSRLKNKHVPLAGLQALFFFMILSASSVFELNGLY